MEDLVIKDVNGKEVSLEDATEKLDEMENPCAKVVVFHGKTEWTLDRLKEIFNELGTLNYEKVEKLLAGKRMFNRKNIIRDWVFERVMKSLEKLKITGDGMADIIDLDTFVKSYKTSLANEITDDIIDTMHTAQRHGMQ